MAPFRVGVQGREITGVEISEAERDERAKHKVDLKRGKKRKNDKTYVITLYFFLPICITNGF